MTSRAFPPAELAPGWYLERHAGWSLVDAGPGYKLLARRRGPLLRALLLSDGASPESLARALDALDYPPAFTSLTIHDFSALPAAPALHLPGWPLREVLVGQWFGVGTYVHDLALDEARLFGAIHKGKQQEIRRAPRRGLRVVLSRFPDASLREQFRELHDAMARERGLRRVGRPHIDRLLAAGDALLVQALDKSEVTVAMNLIYLQPTHGYYLLGVRGSRCPEGAGHLAQWETIRWLKANGQSWYDLGLVATPPDEPDGIHRFKRSLGGQFVPSGREYRAEPPWVQGASWLRARLAPTAPP